MEKLAIQYTTALKAYKSLEKAIQISIQKNASKNADDIEMARDSIIKRFEFYYDITWKYLKQHLEDTLGIIAKSPKSVFQESFKQTIINEQELKTLLSMVDDRNTTSHMYDEETAQEISARVSNYYGVIKNIIERIKPIV
jgi:nucleotidyltransferase substrate binding protein (TIGR01987 family)